MAGADRYGRALEDFDVFLARILSQSRPSALPPGRVPQSHFWLLDDDQTRVLACGRLRHRLLPDLEVEGGHIGYDVSPAVRGRGVGTRLLALLLVEARRLALSRVLITCDDDNIPSRRVIEKNGGQPIAPTISPESGKSVRRYWVRTSQ